MPVHNPMAAALAAAEAQVPVVHPVRSPEVRSATSGDISGSIGPTRRGVRHERPIVAAGASAGVTAG